MISHDVELPLEVDDEYLVENLEHPELSFKQPPGKPSKVAFFTSYMSLITLIGVALKSIASFICTRKGVLLMCVFYSMLSRSRAGATLARKRKLSPTLILV